MKGLIAILLASSMLALTGCGNFNPKNRQKIDNQNGKMGDIRSNQNGIQAEIGKLQTEGQIRDSQLKEVQNGLLNLDASLSRNENKGVQILQGDGALILVFSIAVVGMLLYWYRDRAVKGEKAADIIAKEVARFNDPNLNDNVLRAAMHTDSEAHIYHLLTKSQSDLTKAKKV